MAILSLWLYIQIWKHSHCNYNAMISTEYIIYMYVFTIFQFISI